MKITAYTALGFASMGACASAFAPNSNAMFATTRNVRNVALQVATDIIVEENKVVEESKKVWPEVNGWVADPTKFCAGLPGSVSPLGEFDPFGLTEDMSVEEIKRYRESEVTHGRVGMLAVLGYLVGESFHPFFGGIISGPANSHLGQVQEIAPAFFTILTLAIGSAEIYRAKVGWKAADSLAGVSDDPNSAFGARLLDSYYPGDIGFDPLGFKPKNADKFRNMQTKELNNGRLAMLAAIGMIVQEQITHVPILDTLHDMF